VGVRIADCAEEDVPALQAFLAGAYGSHYPLCDPALLRWQFQRTPGGDEHRWHIKLALKADAIVGCLGYVPLDMTLDRKIERGAWLVNWMVDPGSRHLLLGPLLMREAMRQFTITLTIGPNQEAREILSRMGWWSYGELRRFVAVLDRAGGNALSIAGELSWPEASIEATHCAPSAPSAGVTRVERYGPEATDLWERLQARPGLDVAGTRRSAEFLNWRYADHPSFRYRLFAQHEHGLLTGLAIYRIEVPRDVPIRIGRLVEWVEAFDATGTSCSTVLAAVLDDARSEGVSMMDFFCGDRQRAAQITRHGFVGDPSVTSAVPLVFQPIDRRRTGIWLMAYVRSGAALLASLDWHVTKGDGDQDRPN
jgi:hypothetical protein